ncbi:hypothetical protein [Mycoplasma suis]|uniref:Uncharacterized protein n=2 Tax=Mycoplasma suis TaxID=57372 RepID=F0QRM0_MYCSL|nr:hypothetical protein [Mycoplasma suis]ADX98140.1 hypothetical protein MSU_0608 [Mycoplasma suis str. Illinois]CBZ40664.1 hypothetical protein MSUIS_05710 [Mycoplasma suis KI3806]
MTKASKYISSVLVIVTSTLGVVGGSVELSNRITSMAEKAIERKEEQTQNIEVKYEGTPSFVIQCTKTKGGGNSYYFTCKNMWRTETTSSQHKK